MKILITSFAPFGGRPSNASFLALRVFGRRENVYTRTLPVDAVEAPKRLNRAIRFIHPDVILLLGEAAGRDEIHLETTAWNALDFTIPDNAGRLLMARKIRPSAQEFRSTRLPIHDIHAMLLAAGHRASISNDPGRYLCNLIYYIALETAAQLAPAPQVGFIHLPLESVMSEIDSADALRRIVEFIISSPLLPH